MNKIESTKLILEQAKSTKIRNDELWEFMRLTSERTGLPYEIYVDNGGAYKHYNHKLWLYVIIGSEKVPVTIEGKPSMTFLVHDFNFDYIKLFEFIKINEKLLKNLADGKVDITVFFHLLKPLEKKTKVNEEKSFITEMATLPKEVSGLPTTIWLDDDRLFEPHAPRIKFRANFQNKNTRKDPSMEIEDTDKLHNMPKNNNLTTDEIKQIQSFVDLNRKIIFDLAYKRIDINTFLETFKKVDKYGNPIEEKSPIKIGKVINGFAKCEKNGKINFIDESGKYLFDDFCLDNATDFIPYVNGKVLAYVTIGNDSFYINDEGKKEEIQ